MNEPKFVHSVARLFENDIQREQRALARIETARQARLARQKIVQGAAALADAVTESERRLARLVAPINEALGVDRERIFFKWLVGCGVGAGDLKIEGLGEMLSSFDAIQNHAGDLKSYLHKQTVEVAKKRLADFQKEHADILAKIELVPADEPDFVPKVLSADHYRNGESAALVRAALAD